MNTHEHGETGHDAGWRVRDWLYVVPLLVGLVLIVYAMRGHPAASSESALTVSAQMSATTAPAAVTSTALPNLLGKWRRPDGDYVLEILTIADDGSADAKYYNPRPIHVAKAIVGRTEENVTSVVIVLRDEGYPGNNYSLTLDAARGRLVGIYRQPAAGQQFEVFFERVPF